MKFAALLLTLVSAGGLMATQTSHGATTTRAPGTAAPSVREDSFFRFESLGKIPAIKIGPQKPVNHEETAPIKQLTASLAGVDSPDFGLSPTLSGTAFAPVAGSENAGMLLLTNHQINSSQALRKLVAMGPRALPLLLAALDDRTPTRLVVRHSAWGMGEMAFGHEIGGNPVSAAEQKALASVPEWRWGATRSPGDLVQIPGKPGQPWDTSLAYAATIGDVCFVAVGQIVGRPYEAIRYQPTACIVINSPPHDPALAAQVRAIWSSKNPAQHLLDSLMLDYSTEGILYDTGGKRYYEDHFQDAGAIRLLFYFPLQSARIIAGRLRRLDVSAPPSHLVWQRPSSANQLDNVAGFMKAIAWCREPAIRSALLGIFKRTSDPDILVAALPGIGQEHASLVCARVSAFLNHAPPYVGRSYGDESSLLYAYAQWGTAGEVKAVFTQYLDHASAERCVNVCYALRATRPAWDLDLLAPLLADQRPVERGSYRIVPDQDEPRLSVRVCDEAAATLAMNHPDLPFTMAGTHEDLDRQIAAMRERISKGQR